MSIGPIHTYAMLLRVSLKIVQALVLVHAFWSNRLQSIKKKNKDCIKMQVHYCEPNPILASTCSVLANFLFLAELDVTLDSAFDISKVGQMLASLTAHCGHPFPKL